MATQYLLPCVCGQKLRVTATQAGEAVHCPCGASLTVPSLRDLSRLELAPRTAAKRTRRQPSWSRRQAWILLGAIITAAALGLLAFLELTRPRLPDMEALSPIQVWAVWQDVRRGPDRNLGPAERQYLERLGIRRVWQTALQAAAAGGLLMMAIAYALPGPRAPGREELRASDPRRPVTPQKPHGAPD